jgi:hypothetical protein
MSLGFIASLTLGKRKLNLSRDENKLSWGKKQDAGGEQEMGLLRRKAKDIAWIRMG